MLNAMIASAWALSLSLGVGSIEIRGGRIVVLFGSLLLSYRVMLLISRLPGTLLKDSFVNFPLRPGITLLKVGLFVAMIVGIVLCGVVWNAVASVVPSMSHLDRTSMYLGKFSLLLPLIALTMVAYAVVVGFIRMLWLRFAAKKSGKKS